MSYILDALRRADAERERGHVPGLHAQPSGGPLSAATATAGAQRGWRRDVMVGGTALLALAVVLGGWAAWRSFAQDGGARVKVVGHGSDTLPEPRARASTSAAVLPPPIAPEVSIPAEPAQLPDRAAAAAGVEAPIGRPAAQPARSPTTAVASSTGARAAVAALAAKVPATQVPAASATASAPTRVYAVEELPEDVRRELPRLAIGGSIYSQSPSSRFVIVNGQLLHEGDTVAPGLVLQQIKLKSAVLAFRGYRYGISY